MLVVQIWSLQILVVVSSSSSMPNFHFSRRPSVWSTVLDSESSWEKLASMFASQ